jgi:hypothetical protein
MNPVERAAALKWISMRLHEHPSDMKYPTGRFHYSFGEATGLGVKVVVHDLHGPKKHDVTDYGSW